MQYLMIGHLPTLKMGIRISTLFIHAFHVLDVPIMLFGLKLLLLY